MKVIGFEQKSGVYEGHEYNNTYIYGTEPLKEGSGLKAISEKVKTTLFDSFGIKLGDEIKFLYNQYHSVEYIQVLKKGE